jgi:hypothetical protein
VNLSDFHAAVFLTPAVVGLFTDTEMTGSLDDCLALGNQDLGMSEMADDLFCGITLSCHDDPLLVTHILTLGLGTFQGGRSGVGDFRMWGERGLVCSFFSICIVTPAMSPFGPS